VKNVCIDLDGVLAKYDGWHTDGWQEIGEPIEGAVEFVNNIKALGCRIIIFTTRCNVDVNSYAPSYEYLISRVEAWLNKHGFDYDEVYYGQGKPMASAYIDDRAVTCNPQEEQENIEKIWFEYALRLTKRLLEE
jgi:hypothetical protein